MPPRKRKRPSDQAGSKSPAAAAADQSNTTLSTALSVPDDSDTPPFLNTSFTTYRASPLHLGPYPLTQQRLNTLSQRLRDLLVGDVVRGVEVGLTRADDDPTMRRAGALELVSFGWVRLESLLGPYTAADGVEGDDPDISTSTIDGMGGSPGKRRALHIALQYENTECVALLLPAVVGHSSNSSSSSSRGEGFGEHDGGAEEAHGQDDADPDFLHLPLLLLRMPAPLRAVMCGFLGRTFDCRISALSLGTRSLIGALERWLGASRTLTRGSFAKDVVVTLGFYGPTVTAVQQHTAQAKPKDNSSHADRADEEDEGDGTGSNYNTTVGIKAIDIIVPNAELRHFIRAGRAYEAARAKTSKLLVNEDPYHARKRRHLGGDKDEEAWTWRYTASPQQQQQQQQQQPFIEALAQYVRAHLALDLFHPAVRVSKIACGGFVLSEGRVKIFGNPPGVEGGAEKMSGGGQRTVWAVFEGLGERARVRPLEKTFLAVS